MIEDGWKANAVKEWREEDVLIAEEIGCDRG